MTTRQAIIRIEYQRFQQALRIARWGAISEALVAEGLPELTSEERDAVDHAVAMGLAPFQEEAGE